MEGPLTSLPEWLLSWPQEMTAEEYDALPEEVSRRIEIVGGTPRFMPSVDRPHRIVSRRLANAIELGAGAGHLVTTACDLMLLDVPLLVRRPDIVVYDASLPDDAVLRPSHCVLVVEVMSPGSVTTDQIDKPGEYAAARIGHFWRVEEIDTAKRTMTVLRYQLDQATRRYELAGIDTDSLTVAEPIGLTIGLADLF